MRTSARLGQLTFVAAAGAAAALLTGGGAPPGEPETAGAAGFAWDLVAGVFFWALPDSIATEAQIAFLCLIVVTWIGLKVRSRRAGAGGAGHDGSETGGPHGAGAGTSGGFVGSNPFAPAGPAAFTGDRPGPGTPPGGVVPPRAGGNPFATAPADDDVPGGAPRA